MPDRRLLPLVWLLLWCAPAGLADSISEARVAARSQQGDPYPLAEVSFAGGVRGLPGLVYERRDGFRPLALDLYLPPGEARPSPLLLFVHGGGWSGGHSRALGALEDFPALLAGLAGRGYVVLRSITA